jgi:uncharacterized protein
VGAPASIAAALLALAALGQARPAPPTAALPALTGPVVDMADLLSPAEEAGLTRTLAALEGRTTDQLIVVTTPSLGGRTIEAYGLMLGNGWHIGQRGRDNGVLVIVAPAERKTRIEVGYGLEAILTNPRAQQIVDRDMVPQFRAGHWHAGIEAGTQAIVATLIAHVREPRRRRS